MSQPFIFLASSAPDAPRCAVFRKIGNASACEFEPPHRNKCSGDEQNEKTKHGGREYRLGKSRALQTRPRGQTSEASKPAHDQAAARVKFVPRATILYPVSFDRLNPDSQVRSASHVTGGHVDWLGALTYEHVWSSPRRPQVPFQ